MTVYLKLLHGRNDPNEQLEDWGFDGPVLGPFEAVHFTYATHVRCFPEGTDGEAIELCYHDDLLVHDGKYYGDFEIAASFGAATPQPVLPPDPDNMNGKRAQWAEAALSEFKSQTGADDDTAPYDLLTNLMHWCDRHAVAFNDELDRARAHYDAETTPDNAPITTAVKPGNGSTEGAAAAPAPPPDPDPMPTCKYRAEFFTAADYAVRDFEAATPEEALRLARDFYGEDPGELDFRSYDDNAAIDHIQIWGGERGTLAAWESDDCRLRKAAPALLEACKAFVAAFKDSADLADCALAKARQAIARAQPITSVLSNPATSIK